MPSSPITKLPPVPLMVAGGRETPLAIADAERGGERANTGGRGCTVKLPTAGLKPPDGD